MNARIEIAESAKAMLGPCTMFESPLWKLTRIGNGLAYELRNTKTGQWVYVQGPPRLIFIDIWGRFKGAPHNPDYACSLIWRAYEDQATGESFH